MGQSRPSGVPSWIDRFELKSGGPESRLYLYIHDQVLQLLRGGSNEQPVGTLDLSTQPLAQSRPVFITLFNQLRDAAVGPLLLDGY